MFNGDLRRSPRPMMGLALMMFLGLFGWGEHFLHYQDPDGNVQFGLFIAFVLGIVCGYRTRS
jgi:hypothetical protein